MSEGTVGIREPNTVASTSRDNGKPSRKRLSAEELADRTRFKFREEELEIPEIGGSIVLKTLSVREREQLPDPVDLTEVDDLGERTRKAIRSAAETFAVIVVEPNVTVEQAEKFLGDWPAEAFDRISEAYAKLVGNRLEADAAASEFQEPE